MTERYYFFNSTATDRRRHQASDMALYWESFLTSGLIHENGQPQLKVVADGTGRNVTLSVGRALIKGHLYINLANKDLYIDEPDPTLDRIDRLVLRYDNRIESRSIKSFIIKGETSANPGPPELTREGDIYELSLARIHVKAGKSFIDQSDIIDERLDESVCGLASSLVSVPTDVFDAQFQAYMQQIADEWQDWFNSVYDASYVTGEQFTDRNLKVDRQLSNLNAIADIDNRAIGHTGTFYDLFEGSNDYSEAVMDTTTTKMTANSSSTSTSITVASTEGFRKGDEVTIIGISSAGSSTVKIIRKVISSINADTNTITLTSTLGYTIQAGAVVTRSVQKNGVPTDIVEVDSWRSPKSGNAPFNQSIGARQLVFTPDGEYCINPAYSVNIYKRNSSGVYEFYMNLEMGGNQRDNLCALSEDCKFLTIGEQRSYSGSQNRYVYEINLEEKEAKLINTFDGTAMAYFFNLGEDQYLVAGNTIMKYDGSKFVTVTTVASEYTAVSAKNKKILASSSSKLYVYDFDGEDVSLIDTINVPNTTMTGFESPDGKYMILNRGSLSGSSLLLKYNGFSYDVVDEISTLYNEYDNVSWSDDSLYVSVRNSIYAVVGDKLQQVYQFDSGSNFRGFFVPTKGEFLYLNTTNASTTTVYRLIGVTEYRISSIDVRYNFKKPVTNLAVWLQTIGSANFNFYTSMVSESSNESYSLLSKSSKQIEDYYEYEGLRTNRTSPADKVTLKIQFNGLPNVKKLLGAIE